MTAMYESRLRDQMARDTLWCLPCGLSGIPRHADLEYTVAADGISATVRVCRDCFARERDCVPIVASQPVAQPAYIALLTSALAST